MNSRDFFAGVGLLLATAFFRVFLAGLEFKLPELCVGFLRFDMAEGAKS